jgi:hypothetical protein
VNSLMELISNPLVWKVVFAYWVFSAAIGALPTPDTDSAKWYIFLFRFGHGLSGNLTRAAIAFKVPGVEAETKS